MKPHVLICRLDGDGDVLLAGPAIRAVAARARKVTLLCGPRGRGAARLLPGVDEIIEFSCPWIELDPDPVGDQILALAEDLGQRAIDEAFVLTSFGQSALPTALVLRLAGIGSVAAISEDYPGSLVDVRHEAGDVHEVERSLSLVGTLGYRLPSGDDGRLSIQLPARPSLVPRDRAPFVVVHPGASVPERAPAPPWSALLVDALVAAGRHVVVTGGPGEELLTASVAGTFHDEVIDLGGRTDLVDLAHVLAEADAVVVGNTGPAHLAAAVKTPVVSLFAPVVPAVHWRPWGVPHVLLDDLDEIEVESVVEAVESLVRSPALEEVAS